MRYVYFQTFGCQMNVADSNELGSKLFIRGYHPTEDPTLADLIVVNTCSVREHAEQRARVRIGEYARLKKSGARLWVIGCMAERLGGELKNDLHGVDEVIGAKSIASIDEILEKLIEYPQDNATDAMEQSEVSDFVSVMRGCDNYCAYCIVPYVRGREASIPVERILETVRKKVDRGVKEITLLGQNVNSYLYNGTDFPDLLHMVAEVDGLKRLRFTTSHPKDCSEKLIRSVAEIDKCCKHIHLPFQAGADRVLTAMNRRYSASAYRDHIATIRSYMPRADITTDILVGFPGETEKEFGETLKLVRDVRFTTAFMFAYSVREGTAAASMNDTVSEEVKQRRLGQLIDLQTGITKEIYAAMAGEKVELLISGRQEKRDRLWMARDNGCKRVLIACDNCKAGTILHAEVVRTGGMTLICERIEP
jgi:tRNA-2-methylthio-N6-dimethylallyladenosine synthase